MCEVLWHAQAWNDNDDEISNDSLQSSSSSSGKRGCCKVGRNNFLLVLWLSPTGGEATYVVKMSEWVSEWVSDGYNRIPILIQFLLDIHCTTHSLFWSTIEDEKHLTIISRWRVKKTKVFPISHKVIGATWKPTGKLFSLNGEYLTVWISELCPVDRNISFFSVLAVRLQKMRNTSK